MAKNLDPEVVLELTDGDPLALPAGVLTEAHELFPRSSQNLISVANSAFMVQNESASLWRPFPRSHPLIAPAAPPERLIGPLELHYLGDSLPRDTIEL